LHPVILRHLTPRSSSSLHPAVLRSPAGVIRPSLARGRGGAAIGGLPTPRERSSEQTPGAAGYWRRDFGESLTRFRSPVEPHWHAVSSEKTHRPSLQGRVRGGPLAGV